ncbi:MAG TPA: ATP phosphoribosyltransferase regulatory subunit, partial [Candidatus Nanoarchaeia archaeon]|nr:ATP phosphoribosyltransferase regulatory subunit [Candidatus Nanoarchaeia archaeon]
MPRKKAEATPIKLETTPYKGVRDFYPQEMFLEKYLFSAMRFTAENFGYVEYGASPLEPADLYRAKTGQEIVNEQTYTFIDRGDREVTLRPEMTPTVARMIAAKRRELAFPLRWYSIPNLFRYEQPQKGRLREHYQLNVDLFGVDNERADIEIISVAYQLLKNLGAEDKDFEIQVSDRGLLNHFWDVI